MGFEGHRGGDSMRGPDFSQIRIMESRAVRLATGLDPGCERSVWKLSRGSNLGVDVIRYVDCLRTMRARSECETTAIEENLVCDTSECLGIA